MLSFLINILLTALFFILTLFYLDDFKLSQNRWIRILQILSPILLLFTVIVSVYLNVITFNEVLFLDGDKGTSNTINIGASVQVNRDASFGGSCRT